MWSNRAKDSFSFIIIILPYFIWRLLLWLWRHYLLKFSKWNEMNINAKQFLLLYFLCYWCWFVLSRPKNTTKNSINLFSVVWFTNLDVKMNYFIISLKKLDWKLRRKWNDVKISEYSGFIFRVLFIILIPAISWIS